MPPVLYKKPAKVAFSRNPIPIALTSSDYVLSAGAKAKFRIVFVNALLTGSSFTLTWAMGAVTFTIVDTPDASGTQIPTGNVNSAYLNTLLDIFTSNYYIGRDFEVVADTNGTDFALILTAKAAGSNFNITTFASAFANLSQLTAGSTAQVKTGFRHLLEVYLKGSTEKLIYSRTLLLDYPQTGVTTKDISQVLAPFLDYERPDLLKVWTICSKSAVQYYLKYAQFYGENPSVQRVYRSETFTACLGGYSKRALAVMSNTRNHLSKYLLPEPGLYQFQRWLETSPVDHLEVKTDEPQFLYFMNMRDVSETLSITISVLFSDGSATKVAQPGGSLQPLQKAALGCGFSQLGLKELNTGDKHVVAYNVTLLEVTSLKSRSLTKHFKVNNDQKGFTRYILYADSAGNFKTLRAYGKSQPKADVAASLAQRVEDEQTPLTGNMTRYDISITESDELNTGYLVGEQSLDALQELLLAKYAYRVIGGQLVPIIITTKSMELEADGRFLNAMKIEYQVAYKEQNYTADSAALHVPRLSTAQQTIDNL